MNELAKLAKEWFTIALDIRLKVPGGKSAEMIFNATKKEALGEDEHGD